MGADKDVNLALIAVTIGLFGISISILGIAFIIEGTTNINPLPILGVLVSFVAVIIALAAFFISKPERKGR